MLKTMQHVITNGTVVAQPDHRKAFCRQRLMPQTPELLGCVWRTLSNRSILGVALDAAAIMHAHLIEVLGNGPAFVCDLIQPYKSGRRRMFPRLHLFTFQSPLFPYIQGADQRRKRQTL